MDDDAFGMWIFVAIWFTITLMAATANMLPDQWQFLVFYGMLLLLYSTYRLIRRSYIRKLRKQQERRL